MRWFPGAFSIADLQEMDVRTSAYWQRRIQIEEIEDTLRMAHAMRVAQASEGDYKEETHRLTQKLSILNLFITQKEVWARNWVDIKKVIPRK